MFQKYSNFIKLNNPQIICKSLHILKKLCKFSYFVKFLVNSLTLTDNVFTSSNS